jgi:NADH dehydrogenase FAD-containing subunit
MGKHLVLAGGGHAHLTVLKNLDQFTNQGHSVTLISPSRFHYYSGMGPGMLSGSYSPQEIRFNIQKMVEKRGGIFVADRVIRVDPEKKYACLASGREISYDVMSLNTGSRVPFEFPDKYRNWVFPVKPIENLLEVRQRIIKGLNQGPMTLCVAGGGPAGVEMAASLSRLVEQEGGRARIVLISSAGLLPKFPGRLRRSVMEFFKDRGMDVIEGARVKTIQEGQIRLAAGQTLDCSILLLAAGTAPLDMFRISNIPTGMDGGMLTDDYLRSTAYPDILGGGDCISFGPRPLPRAGVYAVRQNPILFHNLMTALGSGKDYRKFIPQQSFMLILNMGDGSGIFVRNSWIWRSKAAFILKDHIDRRFMRMFQEED